MEASSGPKPDKACAVDVDQVMREAQECSCVLHGLLLVSGERVADQGA